MNKLILIPFLLLFIVSCQNESESKYTNNELAYFLFPGSDFDYTGIATFKELLNGELELTIQLDGAKGTEAYYFPAHLHFGSYDVAGAPMAFHLQPIDSRTLTSTTLIGQLSDGRKLSFPDLEDLDAHIKVHLADSGPDYAVILVLGNIGRNYVPTDSFKPEDIQLCSPYFE